MSWFGQRNHPSPWWVVLLVALAGPFAREFSRAFARQAQSSNDVMPDATPQIQQINPNRAPAGSQITVDIEGKNFSPGAYVSFSTPAVHVVSTRRSSASHLQADLSISIQAQAGIVSLFVSNPASVAAPAAFEILAPSSPAAEATPAIEESASEADAPVVSSVDPPRANRGAATTLMIKGKKFASGARVSFSNPGITVLETQVAKSSELTVRIQIAPDAPTGSTGLFVVNPDDAEVEAPFEVADASTQGASKASAGPAKSTLPEQRFEVLNLGDAISILQNRSKGKGTLVLGGGKIRYQEEGKEVFSASLRNVQEIGVNVIFGVNTGTFHIIVNSGKTYNFAAASFRPADTQAIVNALQAAAR